MGTEVKFSKTFDVRIFSTVMRECFVFRLNQMGLINTKAHWDAAQEDVRFLRSELETAYQSGIQKAKMQKRQDYTELWMFGYLAYQRITEDGLSLKAFLEMSKAKMEREASELGNALKARAATEGDKVYLFDKKSREKD